MKHPLLLAATLALSSTLLRAQAPERLSEEAVRKVFPALVRIYVVSDESENGRIKRQRSAGSGVIISEEGYLVTNHHVAGRANRLVVNLADQQEIDAELVGTDPLTDIAVLKLKLDQRKDPKAPLPVAVWGDSDQVKVGDVVFALGSPGALSQSVTQGIVANTRLILPKMMEGTLRMEGEDVGSLVRWIAHDAVIFGGNSGGPLANRAGEVIGINEIGVASLGGAIPGNLARKVAEEIIRQGFVRRSWTGLMTQPRLRGVESKAGGVLVGGVLDDSPAARAGIQAGDVIVRFNGVATDASIPEDMPVFNQIVASTPVGREVEVELERAGEAVKVKLTTEEREHAQKLPRELKEWGMTARDITKIAAITMNRKNTDGVLVDTLRAGFGASAAKPAVSKGDVITAVEGRPVKDLAALESLTAELLKDADERREVLVAFDRNKEKMITVVEIGREEDPDRPAKAKKPWAAMRTQVLTLDIARALKIENGRGVRVTSLFPGQAAEKAGFQVGDILTHMNGDPIEASRPEDSDVFRSMIRRKRAGDKVDFTVLREGAKTTVTMTLEAPPTEEESLAQHKDTDFEFEVRELSYQDRQDADLPDDAKGLMVTNVEQGGWASLGGLRKQDILLTVQDQPTGDVEALKAALKAVDKDRPRHVRMFIQRDVSTQYIEIEPNWSGSAPQPKT